MMIEIERILQDDHAPVRIDHSRKRLSGCWGAVLLPLGPNPDAGIHAMAAALFAVAIANVAESDALLIWSLDLHIAS